LLDVRFRPNEVVVVFVLLDVVLLPLSAMIGTVVVVSLFESVTLPESVEADAPTTSLGLNLTSNKDSYDTSNKDSGNLSNKDSGNQVTTTTTTSVGVTFYGPLTLQDLSANVSSDKVSAVYAGTGSASVTTGAGSSSFAGVQTSSVNTGLQSVNQAATAVAATAAVQF